MKVRLPIFYGEPRMVAHQMPNSMLDPCDVPSRVKSYDEASTRWCYPLQDSMVHASAASIAWVRFLYLLEQDLPTSYFPTIMVRPP